MDSYFGSRKRKNPPRILFFFLLSTNGDKVQRDHDTIEVLLDGNRVEVDEKIAHLVVCLWNLGLRTHMSCQDNGKGRVWISFYTANSASEFLSLIGRNTADLKMRMCIRAATTQGYERAPRPVKHKDRWWVDSYVDYGLGDPFHWVGEYPPIRISVRFPKKHLKEVYRIVQWERDVRMSRLTPIKHTNQNGRSNAS